MPLLQSISFFKIDINIGLRLPTCSQFHQRYTRVFLYEFFDKAKT